MDPIQPNGVQPGWVVALMGIMTGVGLLIPKLQDWFSKKKKEDQEGLQLVVATYKETILLQDAKILTMGQKLVEVQQKVIDIQVANVATLAENLQMKEQIKVLTSENNELRLKVADLERRIPK